MTPMLKSGVQRWLEQHCESSPQVAGGVVVAAGAAGAGDVVTVAEWPAGSRLARPLAAAAHAALQRARPVVLAPTLGLAEERHNRVISLPLRAGDRLLGAVALAVQADETQMVEAMVRELTLASAGLGSSLDAGRGAMPFAAGPAAALASTPTRTPAPALASASASASAPAPALASALASAPASASTETTAGAGQHAGQPGALAVLDGTAGGAGGGGSGLRRVLAMGAAAAASAVKTTSPASAPRTAPPATDSAAARSSGGATAGFAAAAGATASAQPSGEPAGPAAAAGAIATATPTALPPPPPALRLSLHSGHLARAVGLQALLLAAPTLADGALALLTELVPVLGCERATLAVVDGRELEIVALSNSADWKSEQTLLRQLAAAMEESLDQGARVSHPAAAGDTLRVVLAHAALQAATGHAVVSLPLWGGNGAAPSALGSFAADGSANSSDGSAAVGVLLVERRGSNAPFDAEQLALCEAVATLIGPLVGLHRRAERRWPERLAARWQAAVERLRRPDDPWPKLAGGAAVVIGGGALALALLLPLPYRIGAPVRVEGAVQRVVAAPIDGFLGRAMVRPGDSVHAGDVLVELADTDLLLEQRKWESALAQHDNGVSAALARADRAQFVVSQGRASEARAQLELVRQQLGRTRLVAPMDGIVIKGDLTQTLGAPVQRGDALLTLAPAQQFRLIIDVDERDIAAVRAGQTGRLALAAMPVDPLGLVVQRVTPVAVQRDGRNAFEVEARLAAAPAASLRPGLEGVARIDAGQRTLAWQWSHRAADWLRMVWWSW